MNWQPIETAPKDGAHILIIDMTGTIPIADIAHWHEGTFRAGTADCWEDAKGKGPEIMGVYNSATHWMPLPPPPEVTP